MIALEKRKKHNWFVRNISNMLTCSRFSIPYVLFLSPWSVKTQLLIVAILLTTDLEGWLAKKTGTTSEIGAVLDPIVDILAKISTIIYVLWMNLVEPQVIALLPLAGECLIAVIVVFGIAYTALDLWKQMEEKSYRKKFWNCGRHLRRKIADNLKVGEFGRMKTACYFVAVAFIFVNVIHPHKLYVIGYQVFFIVGLGFYLLSITFDYLEKAKKFFSSE